MSTITTPQPCDIRTLRDRRTQLADTRVELMADARAQDPGSPRPWAPIAGAVVGGMMGIMFHRPTSGASIPMGMGVGALIGMFLQGSSNFDPKTANPDIGVLDARIAALNVQIANCATTGVA